MLALRLSPLIFELFTILYINCVMLQMAQIILFMASVALESLLITVTEVQCGRFRQVCVDDFPAGDDNAYLSHK